MERIQVWEKEVYILVNYYLILFSPSYTYFPPKKSLHNYLMAHFPEKYSPHV